MTVKYHNLARGEKEDQELEELEAAYKKQFGTKPEDDEENPEDVVVVNKEEETWKQRYSNLRSYADKNKNDWVNEKRELERRINALEQERTPLPETVEEARAWVSEYPDLSRILKQLMREEAQFVKEDLAAQLETFESERQQMARERAFVKILNVHPDFNELIQEDGFQEWVERQPVERGPIGKAIYDALYNNQTDADAAIQAVNIYKKDIKASKPVDVSKEVVRKVTRTTSTAPSDDGGKPKFYESQIAEMSIRDYERLEAQIEEARRENRIVYDLSGAAR